jgi:nitronate monooxygenase
MRMPESWRGRVRVPAIAAPMFLVSNPKLAVACCRAGVVGTFPALNQRSTEAFVVWLDEMQAQLTDEDAPYGVNLIVHKTNPRLQADLDQVVKHKVPLVITSLGAVSELVDAVHSYGGLVFHDVISVRHAEKAAKAGVDGLIPVAAGAGGHAGTISPFALVAEIRNVFAGYIALSGCISTGRSIAAATALGADFGYLGTRFIATQEANAPDAYKQMLLSSSANDILYTPKISGIHANFLRPSIVKAGLDPDKLEHKGEINMGEELSASKAWKDIWSAGQGTGQIRDLPPAAELCARLIREYEETCRELANDCQDFGSAKLRT